MNLHYHLKSCSTCGNYEIRSDKYTDFSYCKVAECPLQCNRKGEVVFLLDCARVCDYYKVKEETY